MNGRELDYPRSRVLGGSSSVNSMICMCGQERDYGSWTQQGNPGWSCDKVLPFFRKIRRSFCRCQRLSWQSGEEWRVERRRLRWSILEA
ncbi:GMC family oxidoreductase N-terminal domain-containing protein [Arboricoccus pini]|uniref:GMC family oxidoreductase N-terminal domain-containing protein n=1 Tax=Arboricoccus pini TaxID=1963835 RepID=UPI000B4FE76E